MKVYELQCHHKSMLITSNNDKGHPITSVFEGDSKLQCWSPIQVETMYKKQYHDFPNYVSGKPVVSKRVKEILEPFLIGKVEFLPLIHETLELYMINVLEIIDCVDWKRSDVMLTSKGQFAGFNKLVFDFNRIPENTYMFKIKEMAGVWVFVTSAFKEIIERHKIKGLDFSKVFDSEFTEKKEQEQKRNYEAALIDIEQRKGQEVAYDEAREKVEQGKAMASGKWKMQLDAKGRLWLGQLTLDLSYQWMRPTYIPPVLLGYRWHEVEKTEI